MGKRYLCANLELSWQSYLQYYHVIDHRDMGLERRLTKCCATCRERSKPILAKQIFISAAKLRRTSESFCTEAVAKKERLPRLPTLG
jgi:hypothetical protein